MTTDLATTDIIVGADTLAYLGLDPRKPEVHALVLLCQRYRLDPLLGHASVIATRKGGPKAYITRDGMLEIAHRSGQLDGIVVDDEHQTDNGGYSATVSVWRKDMTHPFTYRGGCGHGEPQTEQGNGAEMALARAERRALRRAFAIPAYDDADEPMLDRDTGEIETPPASRPENGEHPNPVGVSLQADASPPRPPASNPRGPQVGTSGRPAKTGGRGAPPKEVWFDETGKQF